MKLYGLKNCDTCRKALKWAAAKNRLRLNSSMSAVAT